MIKRTTFASHLALFCLTASIPYTASAQDWSQWLGTGRDARVTNFKAPEKWPGELSERWQVTVGDGVSTPALVNEQLYVFARESGSEIVRCLNAATGKELWEDRYDVLPADGPSRNFSGPRCSPAVADGKVVTLGLRGTLSCYDSVSGKLLWRKNEYPGQLPRFQTSSSPILAKGLCVAQLGGREQGGTVAFDLISGDEKWRWEGSPAYASLALLSLGGKDYVIAETEDKIVALSLGEGKLAWETPFAVQGRGYNASTPIVIGDRLFYAGSNRGATALQFKTEGDALTATELWKNSDNSVQFNTPIVKDGLLYGLTANNEFFCINTEDGKTAWTAPLNPAEAGAEQQREEGNGRRRGGGRGGYGSIVDAGSVLLALTPASQLIVFKPGASSYEEVARIKIAESPTYAYPVLSGNRIFVKDQNDVALYTVD